MQNIFAGGRSTLQLHPHPGCTAIDIWQQNTAPCSGTITQAPKRTQALLPMLEVTTPIALVIWGIRRALTFLCPFMQYTIMPYSSIIPPKGSNTWAVDKSQAALAEGSRLVFRSLLLLVPSISCIYLIASVKSCSCRFDWPKLFDSSINSNKVLFQYHLKRSMLLLRIPGMLSCERHHFEPWPLPAKNTCDKQ